MMMQIKLGVKRLALTNELVSLIIPTVRQAALVGQCLDSLYRQTSYSPLETIVVDDGSTATKQEELVEVVKGYDCRLILKPKNTGFAATVNLGAESAQGRFLCLVNNDVIFTDPLWLERMVETANQTRVGVVGARLLYPDGRIQHGGVYYLAGRKVFDHRHRYMPADYGPAQSVGEALAVTGALMLVRREVWHTLNGMSEEFFVAFEDVDFCLRARKRGWRVCYDGRAVAIHAEGSTRGTTPANKDPEWYDKEKKGWCLFQKKWFGPGGRPRFMEI